MLTNTGAEKSHACRVATMRSKPAPIRCSLGSQLVWLDRSGKQESKVQIEQGNVSHPRLSPDGLRVAVTSVDSAEGTPAIWLYDLPRGVHTRFSQSARDSVWSPDGTRIAYAASDPAGSSIFVKFLGAPNQELLLQAPGVIRPWSWSPDGRFLAYMYHAGRIGTGKFDIWILPLSGDRNPSRFCNGNTKRMLRPSRLTGAGLLIVRRNPDPGGLRRYLPGPGHKTSSLESGGPFARVAARWERAFLFVSWGS
jgi:Tol biopolymer transport system component